MRPTQPTRSALSAPWFDGCNRGQLLIQRCEDCGHTQFYPRIVCTACGGRALRWSQASGRAVIASFTVVRRPVTAAYAAPYVVALVDLEEGPRLMTNIVDSDPDLVHIGQRVRLRFQDWGADQALPVFAPEDAAAEPANEAEKENASL